MIALVITIALMITLSRLIFLSTLARPLLLFRRSLSFSFGALSRQISDKVVETALIDGLQVPILDLVELLGTCFDAKDLIEVRKGLFCRSDSQTSSADGKGLDTMWQVI